MENTHNNGEMIFDKYYPQHPLPKEIKDLPEKETICEFCGISYLIHSEIKRLEEEIISLNKKIKKFEELEIIERKYENKCQNLNNELDQSNLKYLALEESFNQLKTERDLLKSKSVEKDDQILKLESSVNLWKANKENLAEKQKHIFQYLFELKRNNRDLKDRLLTYKTEIELNLSNDKMKNEILITNIINIIEKIKEINKLEIDNYEAKLKSLNLEIQKLNIEIERKSKESLEESEKLNSLVVKNNKLLEENNHLEHTINEQLLVISQKDEIIKFANVENEEIRSSKHIDINQLKVEISTLIKENKKIEDLFQNEKKLTIAMKSELDSFVQKYDNISVINNELSEKISSYEVEISAQKKRLSEAHENQEINNKNSKKQISSLQEEIVKFTLQLGSIQQSSQETKTKMETTFNQKCLLYEQEIANYKLDAAESQGIVEKLKLKDLELGNLEISFNQYVNENKELRKIIDNFENQKKLQNFENENRKSQIIQDLENEITEKENIIDKMEADLIKNSKEILSLKQMVQQECEERFELTESLNRAREQLLMIGEFNISKNPVSLPPIPQRNSTSSTLSGKTNSSQNSQKSSFVEKQKDYVIQRKNSKNSIISTKRKLEKLFNE